MLVLTRKLQEKIRIGENVTITVLRVKGKAVRLGIEAPLETAIVRGELTFEDGVSKTGRQEKPKSADAAPVDRSAGGRQMAEETAWLREKPVADIERRVSEVVDPEVSFERVSRDEVTQVLPNLLAETNPLKAMVHARSTHVR